MGKRLKDLVAAREIAANSVLELLQNNTEATGAVIEIGDVTRTIVATVPVDLAAGTNL